MTTWVTFAATSFWRTGRSGTEAWSAGPRLRPRPRRATCGPPRHGLRRRANCACRAGRRSGPRHRTARQDIAGRNFRRPGHVGAAARAHGYARRMPIARTRPTQKTLTAGQDAKGVAATATGTRRRIPGRPSITSTCTHLRPPGALRPCGSVLFSRWRAANATIQRSNSASSLAAQIKSFSDIPLIACVM